MLAIKVEAHFLARKFILSSILTNLRIFADLDVRLAQHTRKDARIKTIDQNGIYRILSDPPAA